MKMKIITSALSVFLLVSCSSDIGEQSYGEVFFTKTTISNVNDYEITLSNGMTLAANRLIIAVNSTPILLIVENYMGSAYFYLGKSKVYVSIIDGGFDLMQLNRGRMHYIKDIKLEKNTIQLVDDTEWFVPRQEDRKLLFKWMSNSDIIIPDNRPPQGEFFINPVNSESVFVLPVNTNTAEG